MSLISRIGKIEEKLFSKNQKIYFMGWANCTWSRSEGMLRRQGESKVDFCNRVYKATGKNYLWFD